MPCLLSPLTYEILTTLSFVLSGILNMVILPLAIRSTKYTLGTYKIIMLLFSTTNTLFYIPLIPRPIHYFQRYMVMFYVDGSGQWFTDVLADISVHLFALIYEMTVFLEALHFVYRYLLLCRPKCHSLLTIKNLLKFLFLAYPIYLLIHFLNFYLLATVDEDTYYAAGFITRNAHVINFLLVDYKTGKIRWKGVVGGLVITGNHAFLFGLMIFCGCKIQKRIKTLPGTSSSVTVEMHKNLFHMIVIQTVVPLFLLHIPLAIGFIIPMLTEIKGETDIIMLYFMFYPIIEPLVVIYFLLKRQIKKALGLLPHTTSITASSTV